MRSNLPAVFLAASFLLSASAARADDAPSDCETAFVGAQVLQKEGKYAEAAKAAQRCSNVACEDAIARECEKLYDGIQAVMPSVLFSLHDGDSNELFDVKIYLDGQLVAEKIDGIALPVDIGVHTLRFEAPGLPALEKQYTMRAGEKSRLLSEVLGAKAPDRIDSRVAAPSSLPSAQAASPSPKALQIGAGVVGGLGVVALGSFALLRLSAMHDYNALSGSCSPVCGPDERSALKTKFTLSYASLGVGLAALTTGAILFTISLSDESRTAVRVGPSATGGFAELVGRF